MHAPSEDSAFTVEHVFPKDDPWGMPYSEDFVPFDPKDRVRTFRISKVRNRTLRISKVRNRTFRISQPGHYAARHSRRVSGGDGGNGA